MKCFIDKLVYNYVSNIAFFKIQFIIFLLFMYFSLFIFDHVFIIFYYAPTSSVISNDFQQEKLKLNNYDYLLNFIKLRIIFMMIIYSTWLEI